MIDLAVVSADIQSMIAYIHVDIGSNLVHFNEVRLLLTRRPSMCGLESTLAHRTSAQKQDVQCPDSMHSDKAAACTKAHIRVAFSHSMYVRHGDAVSMMP